jgi:hypothetical protein
MAFALAALAALGLGACRACRDEDEAEEAEEREAMRAAYWRAQIAIEGHGRVADATGAFDCRRDERGRSGTCGPKLVTFTELKPPLLVATPATGWTFVRWQLVVRGPDGVVHPRALPLPDGPRYVNAFGYADTGELETVTAVFSMGSAAD